MLRILVPTSEPFDEAIQQFVIVGVELDLEHSLESLSKWEENFEKPFLTDDEKTAEETLFYIQHCMCRTKNPPGEIFQKLSKENHDEIQNYITAKRTATWFKEDKRPGTRQIITAEVIEGWMVQLQIPFEPCRYWHLNRLFTLIKVCNEQNKPKKKMGRSDAARQQAALNAQRQAQMGTRG